jgi:hypothetical protein
MEAHLLQEGYLDQFHRVTCRLKLMAKARIGLLLSLMTYNMVPSFSTRCCSMPNQSCSRKLSLLGGEKACPLAVLVLGVDIAWTTRVLEATADSFQSIDAVFRIK